MRGRSDQASSSLEFFPVCFEAHDCLLAGGLACALGSIAKNVIRREHSSLLGLTPAERCRAFASFRNKLGVYARHRRFPPTYAWSREINPDGTGEHMHVLMHVPSKHRPHFDDLVVGWYSGPGEVDVTTANQRTRITHNGKRFSAIGYITKQMTPQAWYKRGLVRKAGGPILGKRGGVTKNLDWRAQAAFRSARSQPARPVRIGMENTAAPITKTSVA
jgi:hypothetical protein